MRIAATIVLVWLALTPAWGQGAGGLRQSAGAAFGPRQAGPRLRAELLANRDAVAPGGRLTLALRLQHETGWHSYWLNPGFAGAPTQVLWKLPPGWEAGPLRWPVPQRFETRYPANGTDTAPRVAVAYGYQGDIMVLAELSVPAAASPGPVNLEAQVKWFVCSQDTCVPGQSQVALTLRVVPDAPEIDEGAAFVAARELLPAEPGPWRLRALLNGDVLELRGQGPMPSPRRATFFPLDANLIDDTATQRYEHDGQEFILRVRLAGPAAAAPGRVRGVLAAGTAWGGVQPLARTLAVDLPLTKHPPATAAVAADGPPLWLALLLAFAGGLLLNAMPCVLPVLSLKALGLVQQAHDQRRGAWQHGLAYALGVVASWLLLGGLLLALRGAGAALGWGFQLQSPGFVVLLCLLFTLMALAFFGVYELGLGLSGLVGGTAPGLRGSVAAGVLATVVATPCTGPFMGTALGAALAQPPLFGLAIFAVLGLGMASPFLLLPQFPALLRFLPRPGAWMEAFKQFLGFLLLGTVIFLLYVLDGQIGVLGVTAVLSALLVAALGVWVLGRWAAPGREAGTRFVARLLAVLFLAGALSLGVAGARLGNVAADPAVSRAAADFDWVPYSSQLLADLRRQGTPVFLDFTARWCATCKTNELFAFTPAVAAEFKRRGVVAMRADWTQRDPEVGAVLAAYGRAGVPLYVLYGRDPAASPQVLPQLLTPGRVLAALREVPLPATQE